MPPLRKLGLMVVKVRLSPYRLSRLGLSSRKNKPPKGVCIQTRLARNSQQRKGLATGVGGEPTDTRQLMGPI